jgi:hypothetical protein
MLPITQELGSFSSRVSGQVMEVNSPDFQVLSGKFFVQSNLRELPGPMHVIGAEVQVDSAAVVRTGFHPVRWKLTADFIAGDESHPTQN